MTDYPRTAWEQAGYPITGPRPKAKTTLAVCHYSASNNIPADKAGWLRAMQQDYVNNRGYSLGYWGLACQNGDFWQIRGPWPGTTTYNSAANAGKKVDGNANDWTAPILFDVRVDEPLSPAAIATAKRKWAEWGVGGRPIPHSDLDYTSCCGDPVRAQINAGVLDPGGATLPPPIPVPPQPFPPPPGDDMIVLERPIRLFDSRDWGPNPVPAGEHEFEVPAVVPVAKSVLITVTATQAHRTGYMTVWADGPRPEASCLNFQATNSIANTTAVAVKNRKFRLFNSADTHIIIDVVGYQ